ncbi:MAG TPA: MFS transporter [Clostridia bacterium]|nr:MFS transporter [Clostridia bacterium]
MTALLLVVIYAAFVGLGLPDSLLGAAWPVAHADLGVAVSAAGLVNIVAAAGTVGSSLLSERLIRRFGTATVTAASIFTTSIALMGMGFVRRFPVMLLLAIPLGFGGGTVDSALNNFVALNYKANHMNWLHCFWGVGATAGPMVMALYLARNNWHGAYRAVSLTLLCIAALVTASFPLWKRFPSVFAHGRGAKPIPKSVLLRTPGVFAACFAFFFYCGGEFAAGLWASSYFVEVRGVAPDTAAGWASMYYFGIMAGRLLSGFAALKLSDKTLVRIGLALILAGVAALPLPFPGALQAGALLLIGLGCAPVFPSLVDETPKLFGAKNSQGVMGLQLAFAYAGGTLLCPLFGWLTPLIGLHAWPLYLAAMFVLLTAAIEYARKKAARAAAQAK